jgi:SOS response regulatory protein OraA/RecX
MPWQKPKKSLTTSNQAYEFALKLLGNRDYSEQELRSRLLRRGATPEFCDQVVVKLKEYHLLDEQRYAQQGVRGLAGQKSVRSAAFAGGAGKKTGGA